MAVDVQRARALDGGEAVAPALDARASPATARSTSTRTCACTRRWTRCSRRVRDHGLVLNPHFTDPMPRDGRKPNEQDILIAGAYNLGFIGIGSAHVRRRAARLVGRAARARLHRRPRARLLRRPALDRPRAGDGGRLLRAARPRLQRRLLEPPHAHGRGARRALVRQRRAAQAVPLQRLRRLEAAHALQAPGPHPADRRAGAGEALPAVRRRARGERRRRGLELALQLRHDRLGASRSTRSSAGSTAT